MIYYVNTFIHEFVINLTVDNLFLKNENGKWFFTDNNDKIVFSFSNLFMLDANGNENTNVALDIINISDNEWEMTVIADEEFLLSEDTVYPVIVDPTLIIDTEKNLMKDTWVSSDDTYDSTNYHTSSYNKAGWSAGYKKRRSYIDFTTSSIPSGSFIQSATMKLYEYNDVGSSHNVYVAIVPEFKYDTVTDNWWSSSAVKWNAKPYVPETNPIQALGTDVYGEDYYSFTVTNLAQRWVDEGYNYGVMLWDKSAESGVDNNGTVNYVTFYSEEGLKIPYLRVEYCYDTDEIHTATWVNGTPTNDLKGYIDSSTFYQRIQNVYKDWNGIDSNVAITRLAPSPHIKFIETTDNAILLNAIGITYKNDISNAYTFTHQDYSYVYDKVEIYLDGTNGGLEDETPSYQEMVITHEIGHALGVAHTQCSAQSIMHIYTSSYLTDTIQEHDKHWLRRKN